MLTNKVIKKIFIFITTLFMIAFCVGCTHTDSDTNITEATDSGNEVTSEISETTNNLDSTEADTSDSKSTDTETTETDASVEGDIDPIELCKKCAKNYYSSIFAPYFEQGDTVNPDGYIEYFIFNEFYVRENDTVNEKYTQYNTENSNDYYDNHSIPIDVVDGWLKEHFDIIPDHTLSKRFYDGNGNYNISLEARGGQSVHISNITKNDDNVYIVDAIGTESYSDICYIYFTIAIEIQNNSFKFLYCKDSTPNTTYTPDDAVKILADAFGYTKDEAVYTVIHDAFTIPTLGNDVYCNIIPYVTSGDPEHLAGDEYFRVKFSSSNNVYVSLNTGEIYRPIYTNDSGHTPERIEPYTPLASNEITIDAFKAIENVMNVYDKHQDDTVYDCLLQLKNINEKYYYKITTYNFIEYDKERYSSGYVPTEGDTLYVDITDGKVYTSKYNYEEDNYSMILYQ